LVRGALAPAAIVVLAGLTLLGPPDSAPLAAVVRFLSWMLVMVTPGVSVYRLVTRRPTGLGEAVLAGFIVSPVIVAVFGALALLMGASPGVAARAFILVAVIFIIVQFLR
jgi:type III secretory pathway component EscV